MNQLKQILLFWLLILPIGFLYSQLVPTDTLNLDFSFKSGSACFMSQYHKNEFMLEEAREFIRLHRDSIESDSITFYVYGYCGNGGTTSLRQEQVKRMSNYVKGELIRSCLMKEEYFITQNTIYPYNSESPNAVILKCMIPPAKQQSTPVVHLLEQVEPQQQNESVRQQPEISQPPVPFSTLSEPVVQALSAEQTGRPLFAVKTNLLFDAVSALNVELEVPITNRWSVAGEWIFPWWTIDNGQPDSKRHRFQLLNFNLEGRYWLGNRNTHQLLTGYFGGLYAGAGLFDFEWDRKGYQGEFFIAAGLSGGYAHSIGRNLRLEYSLGLGYMKIKYKSYNAIYGTDQRWHAMRRESGRQSWFGPTRAKVSLVWMIHNPFERIKKGGFQ